MSDKGKLKRHHIDKLQMPQKKISELEQLEKKYKQTVETIRSVAEEVSAEVGDAFFRSLAEYLAKKLKAAHVIIGELSKDTYDSIKTIAVCAKGKIVENFEYSLTNTPCENVITQKLRCYPANVQRHFPKNTKLVELGIESFIGTPLFNNSVRQVIGVITVMDTKPLENPDIAESMLRIIAVRASAELERKQAEEALKQSEEQYRTLVDNMQEGVFIIQDAKMQFVNEAFARMIGYTVEEVIGMDFRQLVAPEDLEMVVDRYYRRQRSEDVPKEYEFHMLHKDGKTRIIINMVVSLINYHGKIASIGTVKDITERKKMDEELQKAEKLESLGILAGGIAHDFNNILTAIAGNISLAKMYAKPGLEIFDILTEVEKASLRAKALTKQLLTFSKGGSPVKKMLPITKMLKDSANFAVSGSNVRCEFSISNNVWCVEADEGQLNHVINNVVINAQQAMPEGGVIKINAENITVDAERHLPIKDGKYVKISVEDHGIGIPEEHLQKIFDPYFTTKQEGSGLGLATAYSIIKKHDGHITAESKLGSGTTISLYLPASKDKIQIIEYAEKISPESRCMGRILVMDDDEIVRLVLDRMLSQCGYEASSVEDGKEAIEFYKKAKESNNPFDAVIIDLVIPAGMGGKETIKKLLEIDPDVKAIVSSGYSDDPIMANFKEYGLKGALAKPYDIAELKKLLNKVISGINE